MKHLNLLVLRSADIEATRAFYELLDLTFTRHAHGSGPEHFAHEDERGVFEIYPVKAGGSSDNVGLGFGVDDLAAAHERFASYRPGPIQQTDWGRSFVVRDPDGRRVEIKQASGV